MKIVEVTPSLAELTEIEKGSVLTIGNFDGLHIGHRQILRAAKQVAAEKPNHPPSGILDRDGATPVPVCDAGPAVPRCRYADRAVPMAAAA